MLDNLNLGSHSSLNEDVAFKKAAPFSELLQRNSKVCGGKISASCIE